jgi:hypothetical protein
VRAISYNNTLTELEVERDYSEIRRELRDLALSESMGSIQYPSDDLTLFEYSTDEGTVTGRLYKEGEQNLVELERQDGKKAEKVLEEVEEALSRGEKPLAD